MQQLRRCHEAADGAALHAATQRGLAAQDGRQACQLEEALVRNSCRPVRLLRGAPGAARHGQFGAERDRLCFAGRSVHVRGRRLSFLGHSFQWWTQVSLNERREQKGGGGEKGILCLIV